MAQSENLNLASQFGGLKPKDREPASARVLNAWISQAQQTLGTSGPRLGWLVATTVVAAVLQRAVDNADTPLFLLKGGTMLQYRLQGMSRTTQDVDGLVRGDLDDFITALDGVLSEPWGPLTLVRDEVEIINVPHRAINPRRFDVLVQLKGATWRRIQVEIAADEGGAGSAAEAIASPTLAGFGLPTPDSIASLSMQYQIAQKVHACTDPHEPPESVNDRARDVVDLLLIRNLAEATGEPSTTEIKSAIQDVFDARATEARALGMSSRTWPTRVSVHAHWGASFARAADSAGLTLTLDDAVTEVNAWLAELEDSPSP
jgi:hypothetical protein